MASFVVVTFDLEDPDPEDYDKIAKSLREIGLRRSIVGRSERSTRLPSTVFAGKYPVPPDLSEIRDYLLAVAEELEVDIQRYFIFSSKGEWQWKAKD